jgi:predicted RNase H-like HicB family nuclease
MTDFVSSVKGVLFHRFPEMKYLVVYEKSATGWGAYTPDLPGLGGADKTLDEVKELIREAVEFHLEGMREHGDPIPAPSGL